MKRFILIVALIGVMFLVGCSSSTGSKAVSEDHVETETEAGNSISVATGDQQEQSNSPESSDQDKQPAAEKTAEVTEVEETKEVEEAKEVKVTKETKKVQEAKEENNAANTMVVDSILNKNETSEPAKKDTRTIEVETAITEIRTLAIELKQQAKAEEAAQIKTTAGQMISGWDNVKSDIKTMVPEMYTFLDEKLTLLAEQTSSEEIDMEAIIQLDYQIYQGFRQLSEKLNG